MNAHPRHRATRWAALAAVVALASLMAAGCGGSSQSSNGSTATTASTSAATAGATTTKPDPAVVKLVPAAIKSKRTLVVATDPTYAPDEFIAKDGKTIVGFDPELSKALAAKMGLNADVVKTTFDAIIPALSANKYDLGISSHNDTKERQKVVDFVDYFTAGSSFYSKAQGGPTINTLDDLCGHKVAVEKGTTQADDALAQDKKCKAAGKSGVTSLIFPDQNGANLALSSARADVGMADTPVAAYIVKQSNGQFKLVGKSYAVAPHGIAIAKGSGLDKPVLAALKSLIADGEYQRILSKWGVSELAIQTPAINGATS
jgi:polar amino acid transport system substrate-binding protein